MAKIIISLSAVNSYPLTAKATGAKIRGHFIEWLRSNNLVAGTSAAQHSKKLVVDGEAVVYGTTNPSLIGGAKLKKTAQAYVRANKFKQIAKSSRPVYVVYQDANGNEVTILSEPKVSVQFG